MADSRQLSFLDRLVSRAASVEHPCAFPHAPAAVAAGAPPEKARPRRHRRIRNPIEEARALAQIMESRQVDVRAAGEILGRSYVQARRLYRIHTAIAPIKEAIVRGDLDARAAIEVDRIHNAHVRRGGPEEGRRRIEELLERIVREKWSVRRIEQHAKRVAVAVARAAAPDAPAPRRPPGPLLAQSEGRVVIDERRLKLGPVSPEERTELVAVIEDLLYRVRRV